MGGDRAILVLGIAGAAFAVWHLARGSSAGAALPAAGVPRTGGFIDQAKAAALAPPPAPSSTSSAGPGLSLASLGGLFSGLINMFGGAPNGTTQAQTPASQQQGAVSEAAVIPASYTPGPSLGGLLNFGQGGSTMTGTSAGLGGLLNLIAKGEANNGYDSYYSGSPIAPPQPISSMTVAQVQQFQRQMIAAGSYSSAVGRYQFIASTLGELVAQGVVSPGEVFGPSAQDRAATALLQRRGLGQYQAGQLSATDFANNLAHEWASLPLVSGAQQGRSAYGSDGHNQARVTVPAVLSAVAGVGSTSASA